MPRESTPNKDRRKKRIFIVDDHALVCEGLTALINQQPGFAVCGQAATAAEAIREIPLSNPDLAILDISLKDSIGIELIGDLIEACSGLDVLVLSMYDESLYAKRALRAGAKGYVMKREVTQKIIEALQRILQGKFYVSEAIADAITAEYAEGKTPPTSSPLEQLSDRELDVFKMLGRGIGTRQIGKNLGVNIKTVQGYCARVKDKLNLTSATELIREAVRHYEAQNPNDRF
jgi:DNA-binding NarL/FixJ family response regulator